MGRTHTPTKILKTRGSPLAKRPQEPQPANIVSIPSPPPLVTKAGKGQWEMLCTVLMHMGVLTNADIPALVLLANSLG
jgi:hypothetical protein